MTQTRMEEGKMLEFMRKFSVIVLSALMLSSLQCANAEEQNEVTFAVIQTIGCRF